MTSKARYIVARQEGERSLNNENADHCIVQDQWEV
jgi:hypothetical protein